MQDAMLWKDIFLLIPTNAAAQPTIETRIV
jgi:hypothetical protein